MITKVILFMEAKNLSTRLKTTTTKTSLAILGVALILIAVGLPYIPGIKGSTVIYIPSGTPSIGLAGAYSTSGSSPTLLPAAQSITYTLIVNNIASITSVTTTFSSGSGTTWTTLATGGMTYGGTYNTSAVYYNYVYNSQLNANIEYRITCTAVSSTQGTFSCTYYIQIVDLTGYYTINGQQVNTTSVITVTNPTLTFTFVVTTPQLQTIPYGLSPAISIYNGSTLLTTITSTTWTTNPLTFTFSTYTLPGYGSYTIIGTAVYAGQIITFMSIFETFGSSSLTITELQIGIGIAGMLFIVCGIAIPTKRQ
jgi:hypothetical protein